MTTSGSYDYNPTVLEIITEAYEQAQILGEGESPTTDQINSALRTLNLLVKNWQARGLNIFAVQKTWLWPTSNVGHYQLSSGTSAVWSSKYAFSPTTDNALSGDVVIYTLLEADVGDRIGIPQTDGTVFWTTCTVTDVDNITIDDPLPEDLADNTTIYAASATAPYEPMALVEGYAILNSTTSITLDQMARVDYFSLPKTTNRGLATKIYFDYIPGNVNVFFWPLPDAQRVIFQLNVWRRLADLDSTTNTMDLPQEWLLPLSLNLAVILATKAGLPAEDFQKLRIQAAETLRAAEDFDVENYTSITFKPVRRR